jgi:hypothetical protein
MEISSEFKDLVSLLESNEGLVRLCTGSGPINIFELRDIASKPDDKSDDVEYNPARPNNYFDML